MTTDENDFRITGLLSKIIEDTAIGSPDNPKEAAKAYVRMVLDDGWISSADDTPVWEIIELLGFDRDDMDSLRVYHLLAAMIDACDYFND